MWLRDLLDELGVAQATIVGQSLGGGLATQFVYRHAYVAQQARPDSRLEVLEGVGHFPHVEPPSEVAELLDDFISTSGRPGPAPRSGHRPAIIEEPKMS